MRRIDYNKEIAEGGTVGWGWNAEAARKRAAGYEWNGGDMVFNIGARMNQARAYSETREQLTQWLALLARFWALSIALIALLEVLICVTAVTAGVPTTWAVWGPLLAGLLVCGTLVSIRTNDWEFSPGTLIAVAAIVAFVGTAGGADGLVQAKAFHGNQARAPSTLFSWV